MQVRVSVNMSVWVMVSVRVRCVASANHVFSE